MVWSNFKFKSSGIKVEGFYLFMWFRDGDDLWLFKVIYLY